jgi:hypothetical protein
MRSSTSVSILHKKCSICQHIVISQAHCRPQFIRTHLKEHNISSLHTWSLLKTGLIKSLQRCTFWSQWKRDCEDRKQKRQDIDQKVEWRWTHLLGPKPSPPFTVRPASICCKISPHKSITVPSEITSSSSYKQLLADTCSSSYKPLRSTDQCQLDTQKISLLSNCRISMKKGEIMTNRIFILKTLQLRDSRLWNTLRCIHSYNQKHIWMSFLF